MRAPERPTMNAVTDKSASSSKPTHSISVEL
jgi:hypothetical protein